jgi:glycosyltransferase involved in cell wall biosynthesis
MTQEDVEDYYRQLGFKGTYHIIPNGRDSDTFHPFHGLDIPRLKKEMGLNTNVILFIGRLAPVKNVDKIIKAFDLVPNSNVSLLIIGDGELYEDLIEQSGMALKSKDIIFLGAKKNVSEYYNLADVFVIASDYEGFPGVLIEAMASENKIVASPVGTIPKVIKNGKTGFLLPKNWKVTDLAIGMIKALEAPEKMGEDARLIFEHNYSWDVVIKKFLEIYSGKQV